MKYLIISTLLVIFFLFITWFLSNNDTFGNLYYRGDEKMMVQVCPQNYEQDGAICYEKCKPGYIGIGETCWEDCPIGQKNSSYMNNGTTCRRYWPMDIKSRKSYYRNSKFVAVKCPDGYNKNGPMCYKKCAPGYTGDKVLCYAKQPLNKKSWIPHHTDYLYNKDIYFPSRFLA